MYKNDEGITTATGGIILIVIYLFLFSLAVSFFTVQIYGVDAVNNPIQLPASSNVKIYSQDQNFTTGNPNDINWQIHHTDLFSTWNYVSGVGLVLYSGSFYTSPYAYTLVDFLQSPDDTYTNYYTINNSVKQDYVIVLRHGGTTGQNLIIVKNDGFCINNYIMGTGCRYSFPYPNANQVEHPTIKTVYNDKDSSHYVDFYFNDILLFHTTELNDHSILGFGSLYNFAGVGSNTIGFTLEDYRTDNQIIKGNEEVNVVTVLLSVVLVLFKMTVWSLPYWIMPLELQMLFVTLPEAVLVICIVLAIRG